MSFTPSDEDVTTAMPAASTPPPSSGTLQEPLAVPVISPTASSEAEAVRQKRRRERRLEMNRLAARNRRRRQRDLLEDLSKTVEGMKEANLKLREENAEMKRQIQQFASLEKQKQSKEDLRRRQSQPVASFKLAAELAAERSAKKKEIPFAAPDQRPLSSTKSTAATDLFASDHIGVPGPSLSGSLPPVRSPALPSAEAGGTNMERALQVAMALRAARSESLKRQLLVLEAEEELHKLAYAQRKQQQHMMMDMKASAFETKAPSASLIR